MRFFLDTDNDSHWFVIPADKRDAWTEFLEIEPDDERSWVPPDWAIEVGGSPTTVTFEGYEIRD
jgi:hypothetical protein